jgi:hypothetical protein
MRLFPIKDIYLNNIHKDVVQEPLLFLLLKDSRASFTIENENPGNNRAMRWGKPLVKQEVRR